MAATILLSVVGVGPVAAQTRPESESDGVAADQSGTGRLPYPASRWGLSIESNTHRRGFPGADNFPFTWSVNPQKQYTSWGDGAGPGDRSATKRSIGVAQTTAGYPRRNNLTALFTKRMHGPPNHSTGGGAECGDAVPSNPRLNPERMAEGTTFGDNRLCGKSYGMLAVRSNTGGPRERLYLWASPGSGGDGWTSSTLFESTNSGATWKKLYSVMHDRTGGSNGQLGLNTPTFLQAGPGYTGVGPIGDQWIYVYWVLRDSNGSSGGVYGNNDNGGKVYLTRVHRDRIGNRQAWQVHDRGRWDRIDITNFNARREGTPVFRDANGVGWSVSAAYLPTRNRYVLMTEHDATARGRFGMFESTTPWGPWRTVAYYGDFARCVPGSSGARAFFWNVSQRWSAVEHGADQPNHRYWLSFSGVDRDDSLNLVRVTLQPRRQTAQGLRPQVGRC